ncbi:MAG: DNA polymerase III subunit delta' [Chroococcus sp. CMT-3BRIN-NPC107]|jgi:DNA polymerase-3 subunit delta'|nr:DNA polymerase III subunit delta' [Chroococcus sp. CMT-3BRIN-NPC107]
MNFFAPIIGQPQAVELLHSAISQNRIAPAYLFTGAEGIGRSLTARCFVEQLFCQPLPIAEQTIIQNRLRQGTHPDLLWVQPTYLYQGQRYSATEATEKKLKRKAPPIIRTEQIREIAQFLSRRSAIASRSVVVIEKAETMAESAANALLKTLEEPGQATLILIAPSAESLLPTLVSRCQKVPFYRLSPEALAQVLGQTGNDFSTHPAILATCQGSPGKAISAVQICQEVPSQLLQSLEQLPQSSLRNALELARQVSSLELEVQLWLLDYLQQQYWQQFLSGNISFPSLAELEKARKHLLSFVQPRLVWEVTLMEFSAIN